VDGAEVRSEPSTYTVKLTRRPVAHITITIEGGTVTFDGTPSEPDADGSAITSSIWSFRPTNPAPVTVRDVPETSGEYAAPRIVADVPTVDGEYYVMLRVADDVGREDHSGSYFVVSDGEARVPDFATEGPAWIDRAIVYGVIPNKFGDPGIPAVTEKLDYLKELGINALWFSPITVMPPGDYGYAVEDYFDVAPRFGGAEAFKTLVAEAHARDIKVLMDFVPNHSSDTHPYFVDAKAKGEDSPYYDFYDRDDNGNPTHYFTWENLPNLNYDNPEVETWMTEAFLFWVRQFDVDGFRVDVAWGVKERKPDYWPRWRAALKRVKPDLLLLAEASARDPYYFDNGFDVAYDWTAQVGKWAWEIAWESRNLMVYNLNEALTNRDLTPRSRTMHFLNNNDTGSRFITDHGEELTRVAAALLLTVPGIPCVYTGDEWGAWYSPYYDEMPMRWDLEKYPGLVDYYRKLIALRTNTPSLRTMFLTPLEARPSQPIYTFIRHAEDNSAPVLVALNFGDEDTTAALDLPEEFGALVASGTLRDVLNDEDVPISTEDGQRIAMPAWKARILTVV
jgi:cyclomaltodextrinase / maltogenic alpha-amylase / neopullulanase